MGFNTAMVVLNDHLNSIEGDVGFGQAVSEAVRDTYGRRGNGWYNSFSILPSQHADTVQIVAIGMNSIKPLGFTFGWDDDAIMRELARQKGYRLVRLSAAKDRAQRLILIP
jgi:hypothetical protein